jgi:hypothetical protein
MQTSLKSRRISLTSSPLVNILTTSPVLLMKGFIKLIERPLSNHLDLNSVIVFRLCYPTIHWSTVSVVSSWGTSTLWWQIRWLKRPFPSSLSLLINGIVIYPTTLCVPLIPNCVIPKVLARSPVSAEGVTPANLSRRTHISLLKARGIHLLSHRISLAFHITLYMPLYAQNAK